MCIRDRLTFERKDAACPDGTEANEGSRYVAGICRD